MGSRRFVPNARKAAQAVRRRASALECLVERGFLLLVVVLGDESLLPLKFQLEDSSFRASSRALPLPGAETKEVRSDAEARAHRGLHIRRNRRLHWL